MDNEKFGFIYCQSSSSASLGFILGQFFQKSNEMRHIQVLLFSTWNSEKLSWVKEHNADMITNIRRSCESIEQLIATNFLWWRGFDDLFVWPNVWMWPEPGSFKVSKLGRNFNLMLGSCRINQCWLPWS